MTSLCWLTTGVRHFRLWVKQVYPLISSKEQDTISNITRNSEERTHSQHRVPARHRNAGNFADKQGPWEVIDQNYI
jgi:hypothetical protein